MHVVVGLLVMAIGVGGLWVALTRPQDMTRQRVGIASSLINALPQQIARAIWVIFSVGVVVLGVLVAVAA